MKNTKEEIDLDAIAASLAKEVSNGRQQQNYQPTKILRFQFKLSRKQKKQTKIS